MKNQQTLAMTEVNKKKKALGVIGGMGPLATVNFFKSIVEMTATDNEQGHLRIFIDNHPQIPDRISAILSDGEDPSPYIEESVKRLISCGASCIVMPCVTAHYFISRIMRKIDIHFISMLDVIVKKARLVCGNGILGILSSSATARSGLVTDALSKAGLRFITPLENHQIELGKIILKIKADEILPETVSCFSDIIYEMTGQNAAHFLLACTELPIIANYLKKQYAFIDSTRELAKEAISYCGYEVKEGFSEVNNQSLFSPKKPVT